MIYLLLSTGAAELVLMGLATFLPVAAISFAVIPAIELHKWWWARRKDHS